MGVDDHALVRPECIPENDIGRLPANPRQRYELLHASGDLPAVCLHEGVGHANDAPSLVAKKPRAFDDLLDVLLSCGCEGKRRWVGREQVRCHQIDAFVGALGAEDGGDQELPRVNVVELAVGVRINAE